MMHGSRQDSQDTLFRQEDVTNHLEIEANQFATELLMPEAVVDYLIEKTDEPTISYLAKKFAVSEQAMFYRLKT